MDALHKIAGVSEAQRSDAASPPPAAAPVTSNTTQASNSTTIPPPPPPKDTSDARSERRASLPLNRRPSHKSFRSGKSGKSGHSRASKSRNASRTSLGLREGGDVPPTPKLNKNPERNLYGDLAAQPVQPRSSAPSVHSSRHARRNTEEVAGGDDGESMVEGEEDSDFEWGPQHPCFPHPNPHCMPKSREAQETRVIRVKRDYLVAGDLYPQYANLYPEILDPLVSDEEFRDLIQQVNSILLRAFSPYTSRAWIDAILGAATGYFWDDLGFTGAKGGEKELERYVERWNTEREKEGREVKLITPRTTGFMSLDFVVPDPGIDIAAESEDDGDAVTGNQQSQAGLGASLQQA
ncbi:Putative Golgin subfamily A member 7/ERF4 protein [Septoria linicola]|uniref:Ras modification protein ERF4 n=1 Tax=Septoria linicola TaxID=215465 RepID=A0A9Q9AVG9_9PEZI|nr:putative Golgin subfamily A member 7/ERF4 protein [Septoria linicola]USW51446.1 Putative Golgin subfamily A member 7/ERF4 protein [Septoria linicola]